MSIRKHTTDNLTQAQRTSAMRAVKSEQTGPERLVARALRAAGIRFRGQASLPGSPDFALPALQAVLFVHGCFWHDHACRPMNRHRPRTNAIYWRNKLAGNRRRDRRVRRALNSLGWAVLVIWECQAQTPAAAYKAVSRAVTRGRVR